MTRTGRGVLHRTSAKATMPDDAWEFAQRRAAVPLPRCLKKRANLESQPGANHPQTLRAKAALARIGA